MPQETHNFLINYETTATRAAGEMQQVTSVLREQVQWTETQTRAYQRLADAATRSTQAQREGITTAGRGAPGRVTAAQPRLTGRAALAQRLKDIGADAAFAETAFENYDAAVATHIPTEMAVSQAIRETAASFRTLAQAGAPALSWTERMASRLQDMGANQDFATQAQMRFNELISQGVPAQTAMGQAIRETNRAIQDQGQVTQSAGHWLGGYIQRYLVRYLLVWQMMSAVQSVVKDWAQSQRELARAMADVQVATGATDTEMRQYMGTLLEISRVSAVPVVQLATGFRPEQAGTTDLAARMARVTGLGYEQMFVLVRQMQREYGLTGDALDRWADEFVAAHARSGMSIGEFASDWQQGIREYGRGVDDLGSLTRMLDATLKSGARSLDDLSTAWGNYMSVVQATGQVGEAVNQLTDLINTLTELEQKFGLITGAIGQSWRAITEFLLPLEEFRWVEEKIAGVIQKFEQLKDVIYSLPTVQIFGWEIIGPSRPEEPTTTEAGKTLYDLPGFRGRETQAEVTRFQELLAGAEAELKGAGVDLPSDVALSFLVGDDIKMIKTNTAALLMVTEEMNERQRDAVYNWPGGAAGVLIGRGALSDVRLDDGATGGDGGWQPPLGWNPWQIPEEIRVPQVAETAQPELDTAATTFSLNDLALAAQSAANALYNIVFPADKWEGGGGGGGGGVGGGWQPSTIDWNDPFVIPPQYRVGTPGAATQPFSDGGGGGGGGGAGGVDTAPAPWLPMILKTQIDLDGKKVGEGTNQVLGDMYSQAARASYGSGGGLVSAF